MAGRGAGKTRWRLFRAAVVAGAAGFSVLAYVYLTLPDVRALASTNPSSTAFMQQRAVEAAREGHTTRRVQEWVPLSGISENLKRAVLVAEDAAFWDHDGIDFREIRESIQTSWEQGVPLRGASTITQQLAKNLYLSPSRNPLRKLRELIIARRLEAALPKALDLRDLPQRDRVGRWYLGSRGRGTHLFRDFSRRAQRGTVGAARRRHHQPAAAQRRASNRAAPATAADHSWSHGAGAVSGAGAGGRRGSRAAFSHRSPAADGDSALSLRRGTGGRRSAGARRGATGSRRSR